MKRALISVTNKDGVVDFAKGLVELGFEIVSTGGTMKVLQENGVSCIAIDDVTGFPEMLDGRVKTLHPMVHGGLLYRRDLPSHVETIKKHGIHPIDLVCVNLYEFEKALKAGKDLPDMIENIDIGGPSMIRSAAKNFKDVLIVTDPKDYDNVLDAIKNDTTDFDFRMNLAYKAFSMTGAYDAMISRYFADQVVSVVATFKSNTEDFPSKYILRATSYRRLAVSTVLRAMLTRSACRLNCITNLRTFLS